MDRAVVLGANKPAAVRVVPVYQDREMPVVVLLRVDQVILAQVAVVAEPEQQVVTVRDREIPQQDRVGRENKKESTLP